MTSNKTALAIFLVILIALHAVVASNIPTSSNKQSLREKKQKCASKIKENILKDTTNAVSPVKVQVRNTDEFGTLKEQLIPRVRSQFEGLINRGRYREIFELGRDMGMNHDEFLKQLCPVVKTFEQYDGIVGYMRENMMVAKFYVYGDMEVVESAIIAELWIHDRVGYFRGEHLETALPLALKEDQFGRFVELLNVKKEIAAEKDEQRKRKGEITNFEHFVYSFIYNLIPEKDGMALKRFLTLHGDELRNKHHDILATICQELVYYLRNRLDDPDAVKLLNDLIGQPSLLTPLTFVKRFLLKATDETHSDFIKYAWGKAIEEGLSGKYRHGSGELWHVMKERYPDQFFGAFPYATVALDAVLAKFSTKRQKEERWIEDNTPGFLKKLEHVLVSISFPTVLVKIIIDYADPKPTSWLDI